MNYDIIVLGGGPGGYVAALRAAQLGKRVALVEREYLGGICLNWGCIPTKALLRCSQVLQDCLSAAEYGVSIEGNIKPDMKRMVERSRSVSENMRKGVEFLMKRNGVDIIAGTGTVLPGKEVEVVGEELTKRLKAEHIIIATGARSRTLPNIVQDGKHIIGYREAMTLDRIPESMVVIGSGAIGSEFADFYARLGTKITIVEFMDTLVPNEDADVAAVLQRAFKKRGIKVYTSTSVEDVTVKDGRCYTRITGKKGEEIIDTEIVLSAVGVSTNVEGIGLEQVGIAVEKGKVQVNEYYATNISGYYAIGDIVKGPALAHVASREAVICVEHLLGLSTEKLNYGNIPGCTYTSPEIASVGYTEQKAKDAGHEVVIGKFMFMASGKAAAAGHRDGIVKVVLDAKTHALLGCHIAGDHVTEMIAEAVLAREHGLTAEEILAATHPHPTMSEGIMEALEAALGKAIHG